MGAAVADRRQGTAGPEEASVLPNAEAEFFWRGRDGRVVGRIAAILDRNHNEFHEENAGFFGFFESVDDPAVAEAPA